MKQKYEYNGEMLSLREIARKLGVPYARLYDRKRRGIPMREIIDGANKRLLHRAITYMGEEMSIAELSSRSGIRYDTLYARIRKYGMTPEEAVETEIGALRGMNTHGKCTYPDCDKCPFPDCIL